MVTSATVLLVLGTLHLVFTFYGQKLRPRDPVLQARMKEVPPGITRDSTMWGFWVGFNITHSMAAMLFGLVYGFLALAHSSFLFSSAYLLIVGLLTVSGFFVTARVYWFSTPIIGTGISLACYVASIIAALV